MDIERQNFLSEIDAEIKKKKDSKKEVTAEKIIELFNECKNRFGTTLQKLKDN